MMTKKNTKLFTKEGGQTTIMYNKISDEFKANSHYSINQSIYIGLPGILLLISFLLFYFLKWNLFQPIYLYFIYVFTLLLLILIGYYALVIITVKKEDGFSWKKIWRISKIIKLFTDTVHKKDIELLIRILKKQGVNTRPKVLEVLKHYQCLLPRKTKTGISIVSFLALCVSILALVYNDYVQKSEINQLIVAIVIVGALLVALVVYQLNRNIFRFLGEDALNERIEMAISEIWMKSMIK